MSIRCLTNGHVVVVVLCFCFFFVVVFLNFCVVHMTTFTNPLMSLLVNYNGYAGMTLTHSFDNSFYLLLSPPQVLLLLQA